MNELLSIIQNIAKPQASPLSLMEMPTIHFRDILQLLLLSAAVHIVKRAYELLSRLGCMPAIPMQQQAPQLLTYPDQKGD